MLEPAILLLSVFYLEGKADFISKIYLSQNPKGAQGAGKFTF